MATTQELQTRLAEAEAALHRLVTGSQWERVQIRDKATTFTKANLGELRAYIAELKSQLGTGGRTRARRIVFG